MQPRLLPVAYVFDTLSPPVNRNGRFSYSFKNMFEQGATVGQKQGVYITGSGTFLKLLTALAKSYCLPPSKIYKHKIEV